MLTSRAFSIVSSLCFEFTLSNYYVSPSNCWVKPFIILPLMQFIYENGLQSLTELLTKDATALDPGHVINISLTSSISGHAEGALSTDSNGTLNCMSTSELVCKFLLY